MKKVLTILILSVVLLSGQDILAQISVNTDGSAPDASAMFDVKSTTSGVLIPRMTAAERDLIGSPATGLMVFVSDDASFYYFNGVSWELIGDSDDSPDPNQPVPIQFQGSFLYVHPTDNATAVDWATAQATCGALVAFGYDDWYLPGLNELNAMYKQSYLITGLDETAFSKYWSDTEFDIDNAYTQRLDYGGPDPDIKTESTSHNCRCVRQN
ncbi:MAG: DUF1566 domain-containing protein [Bacteroidales bacterium]